MALDVKTRKRLKASAHSLKPIVFVGANGLSANVMNEIDRALNDHQLIKIRVRVEDRELKKELLGQLCEQARAELVGVVGNIGIVYRKVVE